MTLVSGHIDCDVDGELPVQSLQLVKTIPAVEFKQADDDGF